MPRQVNGADARDQVRERPWLVHDQLIVRNDQYIYPNGRGRLRKRARNLAEQPTPLAQQRDQPVRPVRPVRHSSPPPHPPLVSASMLGMVSPSRGLGGLVGPGGGRPTPASAAAATPASGAATCASSLSASHSLGGGGPNPPAFATSRKSSCA